MRYAAIPVVPGAQFGQWVVQSLESRGKVLRWRCRCSCGSERVIDAADLRKNKTHACYDCSRRLRRPKRFREGSEKRIWWAMIRRCSTKSSKEYAYYGARGITVHDQWLGADGFRRFLAHIGPRPSYDHQVDRIDNNKGYEPGNVRWATTAVQARNRSNNRMVTINGVTKCATDWDRSTGLPISTRVRHGWPEDSLLLPKGYPRARRRHCRSCVCYEARFEQQ